MFYAATYFIALSCIFLLFAYFILKIVTLLSLALNMERWDRNDLNKNTVKFTKIGTIETKTMQQFSKHYEADL